MLSEVPSKQGGSSSDAITFKQVTKQFDEVRALDDVSLNIYQGEIFGIVGESGAGKSTFLDLCVGLEQPTAGTVEIFGEDLSAVTSKKLNLIRKQIGVVFQGQNLISNLTVKDNLKLAMQIAGYKTFDKQSTSMLEFVGLAERASNYPAELSGGQRQRVAIARALVNEPKVILFDEPTSALDLSTRHDILELISATQKEFGTTSVFVSHELDAVKAVCDRAALLEDGKLQKIVSVKQNFEVRPDPYLEHASRFLTE